MYKPPYQLTSKMVKHISNISIMINELTTAHQVSKKPHLTKRNQIATIQGSLGIENIEIDNEVISDIIDQKNVIGKKSDIIAVKNTLKAYEMIDSIDPFQFDNLLKLHQILMKDLIEDYGKFRKKDVGVFDGLEVIHVAPPKDLVKKLMYDLYDYITNYNEHMLIKSCVFHYEFEFIHPFSDGNGRMGRLLQTMFLKTYNKVFLYLPIESYIYTYKEAYYDALKLSNHNGEATEFIEFMLDMIEKTLTDVLDESKGILKFQSKEVKKLIDIMEDKVPYGALELMDLLKMKSRDSFKKHYLDKALYNDLIERTIPDKPTSKNQRYIKK